MAKPASGLDAYTPFGVAAKITIERLAGQMMANLPGTRSGDDIEALHDMRVASRRLRAALRVFNKCFPKSKLRAVVPEVQRVTHALGTVRDIDVFLEFLASYAQSSGIDVSSLVAREEALRNAARQQMFLSLDELEGGSLPEHMNAMLDSARMVDPQGEFGKENCFYAQAPSLIAPPLKELLDLSWALEDPSNVSELHQMRIAAKRLRYSMETFVPCFGQALIEKIEDVKLLQEKLGQIHDCDVWVDKILAYCAEDGLDSEQKSLFEGLISDRRAHRETMYNEVVSLWHRLCDDGFARQLISVVNSEPVTKNQTVEGVAKMENNVDTEVLNTEAQVVDSTDTTVETPIETPAPKPVRRRATKTVAKPAAAEVETIVEETPAAKPVRKPRAAKKVAVSTESEEAPVSSGSYELAALTEAVPYSVVDEPESAPSEPQHPKIVELKDLVKQTALHMTDKDMLTAKMAKQLVKVEKMLESLPGKLRYVTLKDAAKAEKWMSEMKRQFVAITNSEEKLSGKKTERIRANVSSMRKKLSNVTPKKGKK